MTDPDTSKPAAGSSADSPAKRIESLERQLQATRADLAEANRHLHEYREDVLHLEIQGALTQLVRGLAHELNNPLAAVLGHTQRLERLVPDHDHQRRCNVIASEAERCIDLVSRLRSYATPLTESLVPCEWQTLVDMALHRMQEHQHLPPVVSVSDATPAVLAAQRSLARVLEAIFDNAIQANAKVVTIHGHQDRDRVKVYCDNDGDTPCDDAIRNATKPFFTTHQATGASGLGLSLGAALLRDMGASLSLSARPGGTPGARVTMTLGACPEPSAEPEPDCGQNRNLVLVVDDEPLVAELLGDVVVDRGADVIVVGTVADALTMIRERQPGAIMIDVNLPDGSGLDLARDLVSQQPDCAAHMALVTGDPSRVELTDLAHRHGIAILAKPFHLREVGSLLDRILS